MRRITLFLIIGFLGGLSAVAQPGMLDSSFGQNGIVLDSFPDFSCYFICMAIQEDDKIVAAEAYHTAIESGAMLARYRPGGELDSSFGNNGIVLVNNAQGVNALAIQQDKKIVAAGVQGRTAEILLTRFLPDGRLDSSFGENGTALTDIGGYSQGALDIAIQADGMLVITGFYTTDLFQPNYPFVARYDTSGNLDINFADGGKKILIIDALATSIAVAANGNIIIGGTTPGFGAADDKFMLSALKSNGQVDFTFGNNGKVITDFDVDGELLDEIAIDSDDKILAAGSGRRYSPNGYTAYMALARYNVNGSLDSSFGEFGKAKAIFDGFAQANTVALQENGKIVVAGGSHNDFALARFLKNGILDSAFGSDGKVITDLGSVYDQVFTIGIQKNGKIVAGGRNNISLARYIGDPTHPLYTKIKRWIRKHIINFEDTNRNAAYYVIEKSTTAAGTYIPVTKINATAVNSTYSYPLAATRNEKPGKVYYRIKTVNKDNSISYTDAIADDESDLQITKSTNQQIHIYPNPAKDRIYIQSSKEVNLRLQTSVGQIITTQKIKGIGSMDLSKLAAGIYYIVDADSGESFKVVKE